MAARDSSRKLLLAKRTSDRCRCGGNREWPPSVGPILGVKIVLLIFSFSQINFLSDLMDADDWSSARNDGSCTVMSAYFIKLALMGHALSTIGTRFEEQKGDIASLQQQGVTLHNAGLNGYDHVLSQYSGPRI